MKKYSKGDVWLYSPEGDFAKADIAKFDGISERPVVVIREADENAPYNQLLVVTCSTRNVPKIAIKKDATSYAKLSKLDDLQVKPYEIHSVNMNHLKTFLGRLSDMEFANVIDSVVKYIRGVAIASFCDPESIAAWKENMALNIAPDRVRKELAEKQHSQISFDEPAESEEETTQEETEDEIKYFDVPEDFEVLRKICKSYCGYDRPIVSTITMIKTVPLADADKIATMSAHDVKKKYSISKSAAGAIKLLATDYLNNGRQFSWTLEQQPETSETEQEEDSTVYVPEEQNEQPAEEPPSYSEALDKIKVYLTDNLLKYIPDDKIEILLSIPVQVLRSNYSGNKFTMTYNALLSRAGKPALSQTDQE